MARPNVNINWGLPNQLQAYTKERSRLQEERYKVQKDRDTKRSKMGQAWREYVQYNTDMGIPLTNEMIAGWATMQSGDQALFDRQYSQAVRDAVMQAQHERIRQKEQDRSFTAIEKNAEQLEKVRGILGDSLIGVKDYRQVFIDVFGPEDGPVLHDKYGAFAGVWERKAKQNRIEEVGQRSWVKEATDPAVVDANLEGAPNWLKEAVKQHIKTRNDKKTKDAEGKLRLKIEEIDPKSLIGTNDAALQAKLDNLMAAHGQEGNADLRATLLILLQAKAEEAKRLAATERTKEINQYILDSSKYTESSMFDWSPDKISREAKAIAKAIDPDNADDLNLIKEIEGYLNTTQEGGKERVQNERQDEIDLKILGISGKDLAEKSDEQLRHDAIILAKRARRDGELDYVTGILNQLKKKRDDYLGGQRDSAEAKLNAHIATRDGSKIAGMSETALRQEAITLIESFEGLTADEATITMVIKKLQPIKEEREDEEHSEARRALFDAIRLEVGWEFRSDNDIQKWVAEHALNQRLELSSEALASITKYIQNKAKSKKTAVEAKGETDFWKHYTTNAAKITGLLEASIDDKERLAVINLLRRGFPGLKEYDNYSEFLAEPNLTTQMKRQLYEATWKAQQKQTISNVKDEIEKRFGKGSETGLQKEDVENWFDDELTELGGEVKALIWTISREYYVGWENVEVLKAEIFELSKKKDFKFTAEVLHDLAKKANLPTRAQYEQSLYEMERRRNGIGPKPGSSQVDFSEEAVKDLQDLLNKYRALAKGLILDMTPGTEEATKRKIADFKSNMLVRADGLRGDYVADMKYPDAFRGFDEGTEEDTLKKLDAIIEKMKNVEIKIPEATSRVNTLTAPGAVDQISGISQADQTATDAANAVAELDDALRLDQTSNLGQVEKHFLAIIKALPPKVEFAVNEARELEQRLNDLLAEQGVMNLTAAQVVSDPQLLARFAGNPIMTQLLVLANGIADAKDRKYGFEQEIIELNKQLEQLRVDQVGEQNAE